nr:unnamed protein product [Callosobruchus chinensis]
MDCQNCGRKYHSLPALNRHFKYECGRIPKFSCPICKKLFKRKDSMERHCYLLHKYVLPSTRKKN